MTSPFVVRQETDVPVPPVRFADLALLHAPLQEQLSASFATAVTESAFIGGSTVAAFERAWATFCSAREAIGVANGTDAIALALRGLGVGAGDEVLVPANTFIASASAVAMTGARPVFVDVDPVTLLVTSQTLEAGLSARTAAVLPVHLYGHAVDMDDVGSFALAHDLVVVEDAAQAHGASWRGRRVGSLGTAAAFSFYPGKNLGALGDGGAVTTDDVALSDRIRSLSNHGRSVDDRYVHPQLGFNSRLDAVQAAFLSIKLMHLESLTKRRQAIAQAYVERLGALAELAVLAPEGSDSVWHLFVVRVPERERVIDVLRRQGIETGIHYPVPCHVQGAFTDRGDPPALPVAEQAAREVLSLPMHPHLTDDEVDRVVHALLDAVR